MAFPLKVWGFIKKVPGWLWLALVTLLSLGAAYHYRKRALRAEERADVIERIGNRAVAHLEETHRAEIAAMSARAELAQRIEPQRQTQREERAATEAIPVDDLTALAARTNELVPPPGGGE